MAEQRELDRRREYAAELAAAGALTDPAWRTVFTTVPRHLFVPRYYRTTIEAGVLAQVSVTDRDPEWIDGVYSDRALPVHRDVTSASTSPSLMARMLESLRIAGDERVLEIGTGTGYHAALLCERLGAARVTSLDIDSDLVASARRRLAAAGYRPVLAVADGAHGYPPRAPYDRTIATCRADLIPSAWLDQLAPGGVLVAPVGTGVVTLTRADGVLTGRFESYHAYFMPMRTDTERDRLATVARQARDGAGATRSISTPAEVYDSRDDRFWLELTVPGIVRASAGTAELVYHHDGSWARLEDGVVTQGGPRTLWSEIESWHAWWTSHGRPGPERIGLTVDHGGQTIWLDQPSQAIRRTAHRRFSARRAARSTRSR